ncbi:MAG TPA: FlgD immunoglobulin-like domain containing protein [Solirubrobacterales bacterium]|jgi:flagellar hook assembly protein FlgD|nr:FlgD immunoglobulin-like domain containing protein [Solirubrobacterales bacterium]
MSPGGASRGAHLGAILFACLLVLSVAAFAVERVARSSDDVVNTVELAPTLEGGTADVTFTLANPDSDVDVLIIDGSEGGDGGLVATLASGEDLAAGPHTYAWDGRTDSGDRAPPGLYALEVVLGEQDRDVKPPGRIEVPDRGYTPELGDSPGG